jgi:hypothetical protein
LREKELPGLRENLSVPGYRRFPGHGYERSNHMKYPYHIEYVELRSKRLPVMRLPKEIELVTKFLFSDVQRSTEGYFLSAIDRVLSCEAPYSEAGGNVCRLEIKKDFTRVIDTLADDETENECLIETEELRELIVIWSELIENPTPPPHQ